MTRLTTDLIEEVPFSLEERDQDLVSKLGITLKGLALRAIRPYERDLDLSHIRVAAVPISSGKGVIPTFSNSVCSIARYMGMDGFVTSRGDVSGFAEAVRAGADIVFMADDEEFIALDIKSGQFVDNTRSTALGYCTALEVALGGLTGKEVLIIGAGRVGTCAIKRLKARGARVSLIEKDPIRAAWAERQLGIARISDPEIGIRQARAILNAAPASIPGEWIMEGAVISSPGVPYGFDAEGQRKAGMIIHDPLQIGVAVMALWCATFSHPAIPSALQVIDGIEALE